MTGTATSKPDAAMYYCQATPGDGLQFDSAAPVDTPCHDLPSSGGLSKDDCREQNGRTGRSVIQTQCQISRVTRTGLPTRRASPRTVGWIQTEETDFLNGHTGYQNNVQSVKLTKSSALNPPEGCHEFQYIRTPLPGRLCLVSGHLVRPRRVMFVSVSYDYIDVRYDCLGRVTIVSDALRLSRSLHCFRFSNRVSLAASAGAR